MESTNPVLSRLDETVRARRGYAPTPVEAVTVDDVVLRTVGLLILTAAVAALAWVLVPAGGAVGAALLGTTLAGLVLGLVISIKRITNPLVISLYAIVQGVLLGVASRGFEALYPGIVVQAVVGTFGVFTGMALLYRARVIRATPRFARLVLGALFGVIVLSLVNLAVYLITGRQGLEVYSRTGHVGWLPYVFSLVAITVGALTFILDFDAAERAVRAGLPRRYAWYCAFGILVGLIFLYWQILRLLGYLRR
ncbi:Bax inhibitor-1/YccA family protein [Micromonospora sp. NPDC049559]|uniref:Bax inhibitor-1/YccA family protein n=1 Tax=Micromonospora sp. NPDC049559 TaxID=3155923 RepID=UPI00341A25C5